jgi:hypothetical protein
MTGFNVYLGRKWIDKVFYAPDYSAAEVKRALVEHDRYDPRIKVTKERKKKNRSGETKAFRRLQHEGMTPRVQSKLMRSARRRVGRKWYTDPKGSRSVTLKNMASVTIIRRRNGTVGIRGVKA